MAAPELWQLELQLLERLVTRDVLRSGARLALSSHSRATAMS